MKQTRQNTTTVGGTLKAATKTKTRRRRRVDERDCEAYCAIIKSFFVVKYCDENWIMRQKQIERRVKEKSEKVMEIWKVLSYEKN